MFAFGQTITRLRAPLVADDYSSEATRRDWDAAAEEPIEGFAIDPGTSVETSTVNRDQVATAPTLLYLGAPAPDIVATDRLVLAGVTWEVTGNRADWNSPFTGWQAGSSWTLRRVEG